jgi:hypothetical protein
VAKEYRHFSYWAKRDKLCHKSLIREILTRSEVRPQGLTGGHMMDA